MKKIQIILFMLFALCAFNNAVGQATAVITPGSFTAEDQITIRINVTGTSLAGVSPVYLWNWSNLGGLNTNGDWTSSNETRKMTNVGPNLWEFSFTPSDFYSVNPSELKWLGFLAKAKNGNNGQTQDFAPNAVEPLIFTPTVNRVFPARISVNDVTSIFIDQNLAPDLTQQRMTPVSVEIKLFNVSSQVGATITLPLKKIGNKYFTASFIPSAVFVIPATAAPIRFEYKFKGTILDVNNMSVSAEGPVYSKPIDPLQ